LLSPGNHEKKEQLVTFVQTRVETIPGQPLILVFNDLDGIVHFPFVIEDRFSERCAESVFKLFECVSESVPIQFKFKFVVANLAGQVMQAKKLDFYKIIIYN